MRILGPHRDTRNKNGYIEMATYVEQSPGDVRRMIEEYARREVLIEVLPSRKYDIDANILLPCSVSFPYYTPIYFLTTFLEGKTLNLANLVVSTPNLEWIADKLVMVAGGRRVVYRFTDRQTTLLLDKLHRLHQDLATGNVQKVY